MSLELKHVTKRYPNGAVGALDVSLRIDDGEFVAFFGPSGSGKTSLLQMIGLLMPPDEGEVWIGDERVDHMSEGSGAVVRRTQLGFVFQSAGLLSLLSAEENVDVAMRLLNVSARKARPRVKEALESVNMENRADHRPDELSGGEQQRVAIARAFATEPALLLADEPTGNLDGETGEQVIEILFERAQRHGTTLLLITHDMGLARRCSRVVQLRDGRIVDSGTP